MPVPSLPAYLRELEALMAAHGVDGLLYGHFGDGCVHARIDFPLRDRPSVLRSFTQDAARLAASYGGSTSGEHGDGRARGELLPAMYSPTAIGLFGAVKQLFDPANLLNPGVIVDPAPLDADLRVAARAAAAARPRLRLRSRRRRLLVRRAPLHRRREVPGRQHRLRRRDVPVLPGDEGREGLHQGPRPGAAGAGQRLAGLVGLAVARGGGGARPLPVLQGLLDRLPGRGGHGHLQGRGALPAVPGQAPARVALRARLAAPLGGADVARAVGGAAGQRRRCGSRPRPPWPSGFGGIDERRDLPVFATQSFRRWFAERAGVSERAAGQPAARAHPGAAVGGHVHQRVRAAGRPGRGRGARGGRLPGPDHRAERLLRSHLDLDRPAGRRAAAAPRTLRELGPALDAGIPVVGLEPSCTAALRGDAAELLPGDPRAEALGGAVKTLAELLTATDGWTPPDLSDVTGVAQPHCHQHAVLGWDADAATARRRRGQGGPRSAAAAAWRATSASSAATTTCRSRSPRPPCCRPSARPSRERKREARRKRDRHAPTSWPTASPAAPSSTSSPTSTAPTWPSCWPRGCAASRPTAARTSRPRLAEHRRGGLALHQVVDDRLLGRHRRRAGPEADPGGGEHVHAAGGEQGVERQRGPPTPSRSAGARRVDRPATVAPRHRLERERGRVPCRPAP